MSTQEFGFNVRHVSNVMDIRMTRVSLAIRRFEQKEGRIPRSLGDLSPAYLGAIPCDPFDGKPMRYRVNLDGSWLIYSVGYDGEDNGGVRIVRPGGSVFSSDVVLTADEPPLTMNWVSY